MNRIHDIDATLRSLDPADQHVDPSNDRARSDLRRILATDPTSHPRQEARSSGTAAGPPRRPARSARRVVLVAGLAAAAAAGIVVLPPLAGGDRAFATWVAAPTGMSAQQRAEVAADCRRTQADGAGVGYLDDLGSATPVIAERRGAWTTVVLAGTGGFAAMCITDDSAHLFADAMIGSIGRPSDYAAPGARELFATDLGAGTVGDGMISLVAGPAGSDVTGVNYLSREHGDVTATVSEGRFALWFPGDELMAASSDGVDLEVTYRDGTTATVRLTL